MTLAMIQLTPDMNRLTYWAHGKKLFPPRGDDDLGYALHAVLAAAFGPHAPRPFALRHARAGGSPGRSSTERQLQILGYTAASEDDLRDHAAAFAEPDVAAAVGVAALSAKAMPAAWAAGRRLGFEVRVRPMIRTDRDGDRDRTRERDAFLKAVDGTPPGGGPSRGDVYAGWLGDRLAAGGATLETAHLEAFRLARTQRRGAAESGAPRQLRLLGFAPDATFTGTLAIRDPDAFAALLARGVGRHRAFGFGMLLLRPTG